MSLPRLHPAFAGGAVPRRPIWRRGARGTMQIAILPQIGALFVLVFARVGTLVMLMPGIGERFIFSRARLSLAFFIALVILPMARPSLQIPDTLPALCTLLIGELLIGLIIGVCARLVMAALQTAGTIVAQSMGLGFAMTVDPTAGNQNPSIGNFLTMLGITLVLASDLHHIAIAAIHESYRLLPPGGTPDLTDVMTLAIRSTAQGFALAVQISAPESIRQASHQALIPITVTNKLPYAVNVVLRATPSSARLDVASDTEKTIAAGSSAKILVDVKAQLSNGTVWLGLQLFSPTGVRIGDPTGASIEVHADWEGIGALIFGLIVVGFFGFGLVRTVQRRRREKAATKELAYRGRGGVVSSVRTIWLRLDRLRRLSRRWRRRTAPRSSKLQRATRPATHFRFSFASCFATSAAASTVRTPASLAANGTIT